MDKHNFNEIDDDVLAVSPEVAAEKTGLCRETIYREIRRGRLPAKRFSRRLLIPLQSLRDWVDAMPPASLRTIAQAEARLSFRDHVAAALDEEENTDEAR